MSGTANVIKPVGPSSESWEDVAQTALDDADETLENSTRIEIESQTAAVRVGRIEEYTTVHVSFGLER